MRFMKKLLSTVTAAMVGAAMCSALAAGLPAATAASTTAVGLVEQMGLGWNLGNALDSTNTWTSNPSPSDIETAWGNPVTTEAMIKEIKKAGFNTVRIPVTWWDMTGTSGTANIDAFDGTVADKFLARVKEVVDYCIDNDMYAIINTHHDEEWQKNTSKIGTFQKLWTTIAEYFKDYDEHLVFEGMNEVNFSTSDAMKYNQVFVDTVRASGGNNNDRLLICTADNNNTAKALSDSFSMPEDPSDMLAVSVHYYEPPTFCVADMSSSWGHRETWGTSSDYTVLENDFKNLKEKFTDNGVGVVIGEYGVCNADKYGINSTNYNKDQESIEKFLEAVASTAYNMEGICPIVWDDSNSGTITLFNREALSWFDPSIQEIYVSIANGGSSGPSMEKTDRLSFAASEIVDTSSESGDLLIDLKPYKDLGVSITSVVIEYTISGNTPSYGTGGAVQYNIEDANGQYHWASQPYSFVVGESVTTVNIPEITTAEDEDGNQYEGTMDMDYLKIGHWYDWTDPSGGTVEWSYDNVTLIFDDYFYVDGGQGDTSTTEPAVTTTTETITTTTTATTTTTESETTMPSGEVYGNVWLAGQAGAYQFWSADDAGVTPVAITGNGTYTATFEITEGDGTGSIECLILDSDINCYQFLPEDYDGDDRVADCGVTFNVEEITLDGVTLPYTGPTDGSMAYGNDGTSLRRNILNTWMSPKISDIDGSEVSLTGEMKVTFTVSGLPNEDGEVTTTTEAPVITTTTTTTTTTTETTTTTVDGGLTAFYGDLNLDGRVDVTDAVMLNKIVAGQVIANEQQNLNGDVNVDGTLSTDDCSVLLQFLVGIISSIPV